MRITALILIAIVFSTVPVAAAGAPTSAPGVSYLSQDENDVVRELNLARTAPRKYAEVLRGWRALHQSDKTVHVPGRNPLITHEGTTAVDEAIDFLLKARPVSALRPSAGMSSAARDHVADLGPTGTVDHTGSDGSTITDRLERHGEWKHVCGENISCGWKEARYIVIQLIVDDNVPNRGHRKNIFTPEFRAVGVAIGPHKTYLHMCVMDFAGDFVDKPVTGKSRENRKNRR